LISAFSSDRGTVGEVGGDPGGGGADSFEHGLAAVGIAKFTMWGGQTQRGRKLTVAENRKSDDGIGVFRAVIEEMPVAADSGQQFFLGRFRSGIVEKPAGRVAPGPGGRASRSGARTRSGC
jgi:hypothetical protein